MHYINSWHLSCKVIRKHLKVGFMKTGFVLLSIAVSFCNFSAAFADEWDCSRSVTDRDGSMDFDCVRADSSRPIGCYETVQETCTERTTRETRTTNYTQSTGQCAASYGDCW